MQLSHGRIEVQIQAKGRLQMIGAMTFIRAGLGRDKSYALLKGEYRSLKLEELVLIADVFKCKVSDLFTIEPVVPDEQ